MLATLTDITWSDIAALFAGVSAAVATGCAGLWTLTRLRQERTDEAALEMKLTATSNALGNEHLVFITAQLTNLGKTMIAAKSEKNKDGWIFDDGTERLRYACSLQIRRIDPRKAKKAESLDWFNDGPWEEMEVFRGRTEINVLLEYENPEMEDRVEFWMEPGEVYRLGVPVVLPPGVYVSKLTFVGASHEPSWIDRMMQELLGLGRSSKAVEEAESYEDVVDENFWSQLYGFTVPTKPPADNDDG